MSGATRPPGSRTAPSNTGRSGPRNQVLMGISKPCLGRRTMPAGRRASTACLEIHFVSPLWGLGSAGGRAGRSGSAGWSNGGGASRQRARLARAHLEEEVGGEPGGEVGAQHAVEGAIRRGKRVTPADDRVRVVPI